MNKSFILQNFKTARITSDIMRCTREGCHLAVLTAKFLHSRRFDGQIPPFSPFFKTVGRRKLIWPKQRKLAEFWPHVESNKNTKKTTNLAQEYSLFVEEISKLQITKQETK